MHEVVVPLKSLIAESEMTCSEVVEVEELRCQRHGLGRFITGMQSPGDVFMLVAKTRATETTQDQAQAIAGFIVSRLVARELHINTCGETGIPPAGIAAHFWQQC